MRSYLFVAFLLTVSAEVKRTNSNHVCGGSFCDGADDEVAMLQVTFKLAKKRGMKRWNSLTPAYASLFNTWTGPAEDAPDAGAIMFSILGGCFMGSYTVPIKAPSVMKAKVHPIVFQCYKSFWAVAIGFLFCVFKIVCSKPFAFTYWGFAGGLCWVPSSLCTITAIPHIGNGLTGTVIAGTLVIGQFAIGQCLGETMKKHNFGSHGVVLAPFFIVCVVLGMVGLVFSQQLSYWKQCSHQAGATQESEEESPQTTSDDSSVEDKDCTHEEFKIGIFWALASGLLACCYYSMLPVGKKVVSKHMSCFLCLSHDRFVEEFHIFGSYFISFSIGAGIMTLACLGLFVLKDKYEGKKMMRGHFDLLRIPGTCVGCGWVCAFLCFSISLKRGGESVMGPMNMAFQTIVAAAWGLLYYREVRTSRCAACWVVSLAWTVLFVILLGREKQT